jgi:hypothetical protein
VVVDPALLNEAVCILNYESYGWVEWVASDEVVLEDTL